LKDSLPFFNAFSTPVIVELVKPLLVTLKKLGPREVGVGKFEAQMHVESLRDLFHRFRDGS
jgi:hypothetical protein